MNHVFEFFLQALVNHVFSEAVRSFQRWLQESPFYVF